MYIVKHALKTKMADSNMYILQTGLRRVSTGRKWVGDLNYYALFIF